MVKLAEVLVGLKDSTIINPPTDCIFQSAVSGLILDVYIESVAAVLLPLHGCLLHSAHILQIQAYLGSSFEYVF